MYSHFFIVEYFFTNEKKSAGEQIIRLLNKHVWFLKNGFRITVHDVDILFKYPCSLSSQAIKYLHTLKQRALVTLIRSFQHETQHFFYCHLRLSASAYPYSCYRYTHPHAHTHKCTHTHRHACMRAHAHTNTHTDGLLRPTRSFARTMPISKFEQL